MNNLKVVVVGGVAGGASCCARLRRLNENAEIIMFEKGEYISFANCGLPYYIGEKIKQKNALILQTPKSFNERFNIDVRIKSEVIKINPKEKTITVKNSENDEIYEESYDKLVLSMGAKPIVPPSISLNSQKIFTLRNIEDTYTIKDYIDMQSPKTAVIIGGGYIGMEMAENLTELGIKVKIIEMANQIVAPLDYDMSCVVNNYVRKKGIELILENKVNDIYETKDGLKLILADGEVMADMVILSIGVTPDTKIAKECAIDVNQRGCIIVNENMKTNFEDIFAVGDAVETMNFITQTKGFVPLAGPANKQGRIAADNICNIKSVYNGTQGSSILKIFDMTVATTGINEKTANRLNLNYAKSYTDSASHATYYPDATSMYIKTIYEKETGKILGVQIVGFDGVDKRCDVFATAIRGKMTAYDLTQLELCYAPPFGSAKDPVNMAGFVIENILTNKMKTFFWHDVATLPRDGSITLLDTRTIAEYEYGHIDGFINIPVDDLRENLHRLDKSKTIYLTCRIGLRGYIATRILVQNGFDVYNLSGGCKFYDEIINNK